LAIVAGMKKTNDHAEPTKSRTLKNPKTKQTKKLYMLLEYDF